MKINKSFLSQNRQFSHQKQNELIKVYIDQNKKISQFVIQKVRKQLQTVDCAMAINVISSLGGGTGSGLGTKTIQKINDQFNIEIFSHVVLPNMSGQTPLQIYNCLLSLSVIQQHSSAIFPIQNQKYLQFFRFKNSQYFNTDSLDSINSQIASNISKLIKINDIQGYDRFYTDIVSSHVLSPQMKYLSLIGSQSKAPVDGWDQCFNQMMQKIKIFNIDFSLNQQYKRRQCLLSGEIIGFGKQTIEYEKKYKKKIQSGLNLYQTKIQFNQIYCNGTQTSSLIKQMSQLQTKKQKQLIKNNHEALLIMNHSNITRYLNYLCDNGRNKYQNKAYLWHYQYVDIQQALQNVQNTLDQYNMYTHQTI